MTSIEPVNNVEADIMAVEPGSPRDWELYELRERIAELELSIEDEGWIRLSGDGSEDFTRQGLANIVKQTRLYYLKNPLVNRAVEVSANYVFAQGVNIKAKDQRVQEVVDTFWDDPKNQMELTTDEALAQKEIDLQSHGNLFFAFFANPSNGRVRVRAIPFAQIQDIYFNPEDGKEPWYYKRVWRERRLDADRRDPTDLERSAWYPDFRFAPENAPARLAMDEVIETPIMHIHVGGFSDMRFGVPETYQAIDWAKSYKNFLTDWAGLTHALTKFAWKVNVKGGQDKVTALAEDFARAPASAEQPQSNRRTGGAGWVQNDAVDLSAMPKAGATMSAEDGRRLLLMVAAAVGLPETFFGDVSVGTLATATSLDRPTELRFKRRQSLWKGVITAILSFVVDKAIEAPNNDLPGDFQPPAEDDGQDLGRWALAPPDEPEPGQPLPEEGDRTIDVTFPPILERDVAAAVTAIVSAVTLNGSPVNDTIITPEQASRLILEAAGIDDVDDWLKDIFPVDDQGKPILRADQQRREELQAKADLTKLQLAGRVPQQDPNADPNAPPKPFQGAQNAREAVEEAVRLLLQHVETKMAALGE